jgi:hypothetical protein
MATPELAREDAEDKEGRLTALERKVGTDADENRKFPKEF